jgi:hypothetical protein
VITLQTGRPFTLAPAPVCHEQPLQIIDKGLPARV